MRVLDASERFLLVHEHEDVFLIEKEGDARRSLGSHWADPEAGLIGPHEEWFLSAGEGLLYFDFTRGLVALMRTGFADQDGVDHHAPIHSVRLESAKSVRILVDPWSRHASTWRLSIPDLSLTRIAEGPSLADQPWQETVDF